MPGSGRYDANSPPQRYLIDHHFTQHLAAALRTADWHAISVPELFQVGPQARVPDQELIPRCAAEGLAWITMDLRARRQHRQVLLEHQINVLWVRTPPTGMNTRHQLAVVANGLRHFDARLAAAPEWVLHCEVGWALPEPVHEIERFPRRSPGTPAS